MNVVDLQVEVEGDCIIVSMPGTSFRATHLKSQDPRDQRQLVESLAMSIDKEAPVPRKEFEAKAWEAVTAKARELGGLRSALIGSLTLKSRAARSGREGAIKNKMRIVLTAAAMLAGVLCNPVSPSEIQKTELSRSSSRAS